MKKLSVFIAVLFLISCQPEINVIINKEPGRITGIVVPVDETSTVELYQGSLIDQTTTDADGFFEFEKVSPGTYRLVAKADHYGSVELSGIRVSDSEGYDVGIIELSLFPSPLMDIYPYNGARDVSAYNAYIRLYFSEYMLPEAVEEAFSITPELNNINFTYPSYSSGYSRYSYSVHGDFKPGTEYTYTIDTTAVTAYGKKLEFSYSGSFTLEEFKITGITWNGESNSELRITFNTEVPTDNFDKITINPPTATYRDNDNSSSRGTNSSTYIRIYPAISWMTDTTYTVFISSEITESGGTALGRDSTFTFVTLPIAITSTSPRNDQYFISVLPDIMVRFNNIVDESTIADALSVFPEAVYEIWTYYRDGYNYFYLNVTADLQNKTEYVVELGTDLKDYYGRHLKAPYSFRFTTQ
ncbi:Ig-like domain-containing protein [bacterium]|nr:Ig-like domain-containing protein [bacterium]MBU1066014.1 Ig-like domain-containing protein [bacterium]MBU1633783.1 Ig-like domain-containing protein [bacterium]MBU1873601.1 Ig-like domain-containing protein [bacterium]